MARPSHPKKEVEEALKHAETQGWRVTVGGSHAWGRIYWGATLRKSGPTTNRMAGGEELKAA